MQPDGPYRFTEVMGACQVGRAWSALDGQGRPALVVVLDGAAAADQRWREAFANAVNALAQAADGHRYLAADFYAAHPWAAYPPEESGVPHRLFQTLGMDYRPVAGGTPPPPAPVQPVSAAPQPVSASPQPVSASPQPVSASPLPTSAPPQPVSVPPQPTSGPPQLPWVPQPWAVTPQPVSGAPLSPAAEPTPGSSPPYDTFSAPGRRITPVEPPRRSRTGLWVAMVVLAAVVAGGAGVFVGTTLGDDGAAPGPAPSASPTLAPFEANQFSLNKAKFEGDLAPLAEPWLSRMGGCAADTEVGGPKRPADEKRHVFCRYGGLSLHFGLYDVRSTKDAARAYRQQLNLAGGSLAPGLREATRTTGGVSGAAGSYVEYAFKGDDGRTICGVWWDRDDGLGALYLETLCEAGVGGNWDALRDLWRRTS
ncbi:hypothetical protein OOK41_27940 [Micromonospora sp. NBC_01655]|uniref:hypothetical protein n=1 Tax=Micromonospora sp. NBC_01655 TaxID=2975983 RepID=UPI0022508C42|nr:hypothetical protein [Micromonospora sp. NBC_01655]MCX4474094.1 hypothetical protein [Micromonospora sp. NBC_01655]